MKNYNINDYISKYILENNIPVGQIIKATNIPEEKLLGGEPLSSKEFLDLCFYLNLSPEKLRKQKKDK